MPERHAVTLILHMRPISLNHLRVPIRMGRSMRLVTNPAKKTELKLMETEVARYRDELMRFASRIDRKKGGVIVSCWFNYPREEFFTKKGEISLSLPDVDNSFKVLKDKIFAVMGVNDGLVVEVRGVKVPVDGDAHIVVRLELQEQS